MKRYIITDRQDQNKIVNTLKDWKDTYFALTYLASLDTWNVRNELVLMLEIGQSAELYNVTGGKRIHMGNCNVVSARELAKARGWKEEQNETKGREERGQDDEDRLGGRDLEPGNGMPSRV